MQKEPGENVKETSRRVRLATGWKAWGSNPGGGELFRTHPHRPWGQPSLLYNGYCVFPGGKVGGAWRSPPTPHLAPRLRIEESYTSPYPLELRSLL